MNFISLPVLYIHLDPIAAPRPRLTRTGLAYMPTAYKVWQRAAVAQLQDQYSDIPIERNTKIVIEYIFKRPKSLPKRQAKRKAKTSKPDLDNCIKCTLDTLVRAGVLKDDNIVTEIRSVKVWGAIGDTPHTSISIIHQK